LNEKQPITAQMALRIGKMCGNGPNIWLNLQRTYDLRMAEAEIGDKLDAIPLLKAA
jgi:addiction module HigA family antidote